MTRQSLLLLLAAKQEGSARAPELSQQRSTFRTRNHRPIPLPQSASSTPAESRLDPIIPTEAASSPHFIAGKPEGFHH